METTSDLIIKDNLIPITEKDALSGQFHAVALREAHGGGFHFYRRDNHLGTWSHKMGPSVPTDKDDAGNPIIRPDLAKQGLFPQFSGYFTIPDEGILYVPRLSLP